MFSDREKRLESGQPLITQSDVSDLDDGEFAELHTQEPPKSLRTRTVLIHVCLLVLNFLICSGFVVLMSPSCTRDMDQSISPLQRAMRRKDYKFDTSSIYLPNGTVNLNRSQFGGPPRKELSTSWHNLTQYLNLRLQPEELGQFAHDEGIIQLTDGSGAYGTLGVYHGLHCVNRLHQYFYKDHYYSDVTDAQKVELLKHHTEHCIDWLRQYVQCNADLTVMPMYWGTKHTHPLSLDRGRHQCIEWERLQDWARERSFNAFQHGLLMHPIFGDPFATSRPDKTGLVEDDAIIEHASNGKTQ